MNTDAFEGRLRGHGKKLYASEHRLGFTGKDLNAFWTFTDGLRRKGTASQAKDTSRTSGTIGHGPMGREPAATDFDRDLGVAPC
ncbi:hypothetical protein [Streptomyces sp. NPDC088725]|uniref:hypothetical protein n=1 Tax=Streptomyces sp. NPDC088725 TaxID=3365873 RepID=UPI00381FDE4B